MRLVDGKLCWSATDLTTAATCEYAVLRQLDERLGRGSPRSKQDDPLLEQIARVGARHEQEVRGRLEADGAKVLELDNPPGWASYEELAAMHEQTLGVLATDAEIVYQAGFFDGEFLGFADFLVRSD